MNLVRSFEESGSDSFGDILSRKKARGQVKVGLLTCGYFEYWRMYPALKALVEGDLAHITTRIEAAVGSVTCSGMVDTLDAADTAGRMFAAAGIDILILVEGTYIPDFITLHAINYVRAIPLLVVSTQTADDVDPSSDYQHSLRNSGVIGVAQLTGTLRKMKRKFKTCVGAISEDALYEKIADDLRAVRAVNDLREANIGVIGHVFRGMYDLELSKTFLKSTFDVNVVYIQSGHLIDAWEAVDPAEARALAHGLCARFRQRGVTDDDVVRSSRLAIAMREIARRFNLDAMCFLDQYYVQRQTRTSARIGASLLMETEGVSVACEGDLGGLVMMMLMRTISGRAPLMGEWGEFDTSTNSCLIIGHGIATPDLAASDADVILTRTPEEWGFDGAGLNYEFIMRPGTVTLAHLIEVESGYRMLVTKAESIPYPTLSYDELHAMVRVKTPVRDYLERIFDAGVAHHVIAGTGDMAGALARVAEILNVEILRVD